jgi:uracil-DNA glycosylase family 4
MPALYVRNALIQFRERGHPKLIWYLWERLRGPQRIIIEKMSLSRNNVHILNVCKCRPPDNRTPDSHEVEACLPYLKMQLKVIDPKVIVTLGTSATNALLGSGEGITKRRGGIYHIDIDEKEYTIIPTFHPAYLLRNSPAKKKVAEDLALVMRLL